MRRIVPLVLVLTVFAVRAESLQRIPNRLIDYDGFADNVTQVRALRASRRVSEADFVRMASEPGTVVLDARSARMYELRHVAGAVNLDFTEFTAAALAKVIPTRDTRILIYCNNNFLGAPESLPTKHIASALNVSTFVSLFAYGYRNVYELGPVIDVARSKIAFAGSEVR
jgi:hypothetical protein